MEKKQKQTLSGKSLKPKIQQQKNKQVPSQKAKPKNRQDENNDNSSDFTPEDKNISNESEIEEEQKSVEDQKEDQADVEDEENNSSQKQEEEIEEEIEEEVEEDSHVIDEQLANFVKVDRSSQKEKIRKITDFKFRIMDLLEIIIKKSQSQDIFITCLEQLIDSINSLSRDKQKNLSEKLCSMMKCFIDKNQKLSIDYKDNIDKCIIKLIQDMAKANSKKIQKTYNYGLFVLLKIRMNNFSQEESFATAFKNVLREALQKSAMKRDICYSQEFYKELFKQFPELSQDLLPDFFQYCNFQKDGGSREYNKKIIIDSLAGILASNQSKVDMSKQLEESKKYILSVIEGPIRQFQEIKNKRYAQLNKYIDIVIKYCSKVQDCQDIKDKLKNVQEFWLTLKDKNVINISKRIDKFMNKQ